MANVTDWVQKIKTHQADFYLGSLVIFSLLLVWGLIKYGEINFNRVPVRIENLNQSAMITKSLVVSNDQGRGGGTVVASKNGTKYYWPWCSGANRIKASNQVSFISIAAARAAGYTPASNCKGLQ